MNHVICEEIHAEWLDYSVPGAEEKELILKTFYGPFPKEILNSKIDSLKKERNNLLSRLGVLDTIAQLTNKIPIRKENFTGEEDKPSHLSFTYSSAPLYSGL